MHMQARSQGCAPYPFCENVWQINATFYTCFFKPSALSGHLLKPTIFQTPAAVKFRVSNKDILPKSALGADIFEHTSSSSYICAVQPGNCSA